MSHDTLTNDSTENMVRGDSIIIPLVEVTKLQYQNARKPKDDIVAETKFGFVIKIDDRNVAYIQHDNKCYRGQMFTDNLVDFQNGILVVQTNITAIINKPDQKSGDK